MPHALAPHLGQRHLDAAAVADHAAVPDALVEQAVPLRLEGAVVDGLGLRHLAPRPPGALALQLQTLALLGVARAPDLLWGGDPDLDIVEARALWLAPAPEIDHRVSLPLLFNFLGGAQGHLQPDGLEFLHKYVEGLGD